jgi:hypothetical protein
MGSTCLHILVPTSHLLAACLATFRCLKFDFKLLKLYHQINLHYPKTSCDEISKLVLELTKKTTFINVCCIL